MKPSAFDYVCPSELDEALAALAEHSGDAAVLAGGQSLVPLLALRMARFDLLVDINRIDSLRGIEVRNGHLVIGATTRQTDVSGHAHVAQQLPVVADATHYIGHFQIRNRGTVGGAIAFADPAGEWPALGLALDGVVEVASTRGRRELEFEDLLSSAWVTTLEPDELLTSVRLPLPVPRSGAAIEEVARRHGDFALVGVVASVALDPEDRISKARVALFGVGDRAVRAHSLEEALVGERAADLPLEELARQASDQLNPLTDVNGTGAYRRQVAGPVIVRALQRALATASGAASTNHGGGA
jgi:carbon-monoxide dehydrogenase medium subunit